MSSRFLLFFAFCFLLFVYNAKSQLFGGIGYSYASPTESALDDFSGYTITLQKDFREGKNIEMLISVGASVMNDDFDIQPAPIGAAANNLSGAILARKKFRIGEKWTASVFAGPFASWLWYYRQANIINTQRYISGPIYGIEGGVMTTFRLTENVNLRLIPLHLQIDPNNFRHGAISVLISWR